jgi:hypothetical protein
MQHTAHHYPTRCLLEHANDPPRSLPFGHALPGTAARLHVCNIDAHTTWKLSSHSARRLASFLLLNPTFIITQYRKSTPTRFYCAHKHTLAPLARAARSRSYARSRNDAQ